MKHGFIFCAALAAAPALCAAAQPEHPSSNCLWYRLPAGICDANLPWAEGSGASGNIGQNPTGTKQDTWESRTLPIGNGRVGGTIFGGDRRDRVVLNEVSLWTGGPNLPHNGNGYKYGPKATREQFGSFQPFGDLFIDFDYKGSTEHFSRSLNLNSGIADVQFDADGVHYTRECYVSHPDNVLVYTATADKAGCLNAKLALTPCHTVSYSAEGNTLIMSGTLTNGEQFEGRMAVQTENGSAELIGGAHRTEVEYTGKGDRQYPAFDAAGMPYFRVSGADKLVVCISLATDYKEDYHARWKGEAPAPRNERVFKALQGKSEADIRAAHIADHAALFNRVSISLGKTDAATAQLPTAMRIEKYRKTLCDPELEATIYQYGRYMLIAGSRPGNLPLNLQGIWNDKVHAAWGSDYHNNINLQMCYWGAEVGNLSECHMNFIDYIRAMEEPLHHMTQKQFGAHTQGWTTRISQNPWGGGGWVKWNPPVNAWYALHIWDHFQYTQDKEYLRNTGYPLLKSICHFWESHLKEIGEEGEGLLTDINADTGAGAPLTAAEHPELKRIKAGSLVSPAGWSHEWGPVEDGCMHDQQLIWELFDNTAKAAAILGVDKDWAAGLINKRDRLVTNRVADGGYLQEWIVDRPDKVSGHRHTSHLIGVFPGSTISRAKTPELAAAAMKSLELRGLSGDNRRSWTWPWRTALWARFGDTENAYFMVQNYIRYNVLDNLFGVHPPMQLDGTYGMTGGMSEMLLQSHEGTINLLPTLPAAWKDGHISGIRARGNITVDMQWQDGKVTSYQLTTTTPNPAPVTVLVNGEQHEVTPTVVPAAR